MAGTVADLLSGQSAATPSVAPAGPSVAPLPPGFVVDDSSAASPPAPPPGFQIQPAGPSGIGANLKAGAVEGVTGTLGSIVDAVNPVNAVRGMANDVAGMYDLVTGKTGSASQHLQQQAAYQRSLNPTPHKLNEVVQATTGYNPENTTATTFPERLARGVAAGATGGLVFPAGEGMTVASLMRNGVIGAGAGAGSTTAAEVAPDSLKPVAAAVGGLAGGGAVGAGEAAAQAARGAGVPGVVRNLAAGVSPSAAETAAGRVLANAATDPAAAAASLEQPSELVAGSQPTTFQQTGDMGLGSLEREVAAKNPSAFNQRRADQNAARTQALGDIQRGADPNDVSKTLRQQFADLDAQTEAHVNQHAQAAQARAAQIGGNGVPEDYGQQIRAIVNDAEEAARKRESGLWNAVDPTGTLTGNVSQTVQAAKDIAASIPPTAKPMGGEEAGIFRAAQNMPPLSPVSDLIALRSRLSTEMRNELTYNGSSPTYARLSQLRGAIQDNLADTISQHIANEQPAIQQGLIDPSQSIAAKIQSWRDGFYTNRAAALAPSDGGLAPDAGAGSVSVPGVRGAASEVGTGAGGSPGPSGLSGTPSFDEEAGQRLAAATAATKQRAATFGQQPLASITAKAGASDQFRLNEGFVPRKVFHPGSSGYTDLRSYLDAVGDARGMPPVVDYAATSLRRAAMNEDGTLDPAKYERWRAAHTDALRALPDDAKARFTDAASATQALADARAARSVALKQAQSGAIERVMNLTEPQDVTRTVGTILNSRTAVADMKRLALATKGNAEARAGLRQAVADYMSNKLLGNTEAGTSGTTAIKGDAYQTFIKNARPALHLIFTPEEVRTMEAVAEDIQRSNRSISAVKLPGGSNTAQDTFKRTMEAAKKGGHSVMGGLMALMAEHHGGLPAAAAAFGLNALGQALHGRGVARIDELVTQAMLNPKLAADLLKKVPPKVTPATFRPIAAALIKSVAPTSAATSQP